MKERWAAVVGYKGLYEVSNIGRVRKLPIISPPKGCYKTKNKRYLSLFVNIYGYVRIALWCNKKTKTTSAHRLVALAFIPNPENKPCVCHKNDIKDDNRVENLFWGTHKEQLKTECKHGHEFNEENTYLYPSGKRGCRVCAKKSNKKFHIDNRESINKRKLIRYHKIKETN